MQINGKTFMVSGAASGLGFAVSDFLLEKNAQVVRIDINNNGVDTESERSLSIVADITVTESVETTVTKARQRFGEIHGLINCAGMLSAGRLIADDGQLFDLDEFQQCLQVNLIGSFDLIRQVSPVIAENRPNSDNERGVIINTSSIAAFEGQVGQVAYSASKAAVIGMMLPVARELADYGIRVMTIAPGIIETPMVESIKPSHRQALEHRILFPSRFGRPIEFAELVCQIIENPMLNAEIIRLDGGLRM